MGLGSIEFFQYHFLKLEKRKKKKKAYLMASAIRHILHKLPHFMFQCSTRCLFYK